MLSLCSCTSSNNSSNSNISGSENHTPITIDSFNKKIETQKGYYQIDYLSVESKNYWLPIRDRIVETVCLLVKK